jgi:hypothetical protein
MRRSWRKRRSATGARRTLPWLLAILLLPWATFAEPRTPEPSTRRPGTVPLESVSVGLYGKPADASVRAEIDSLARWPKDELAAALWTLEARLSAARLDSALAASRAQATIDTLKTRLWRKDLTIESLEREQKGTMEAILDALDFTLGAVVATIAMLLSGKMFD